MNKNDISDKEDIKVFVDAFYEKVRKDDLIGPVFAARVASPDWPAHLNRMYSFWNTVLFGKADYRGNPFARHASLPIHAEHFERWTQLFIQTIEGFFQGTKAEEAKYKANKMALMFQSKLEHLRSNGSYISIL